MARRERCEPLTLYDLVHGALSIREAFGYRSFGDRFRLRVEAAKVYAECLRSAGKRRVFLR